MNGDPPWTPRKDIRSRAQRALECGIRMALPAGGEGAPWPLQGAASDAALVVPDDMHARLVSLRWQCIDTHVPSERRTWRLTLQGIAVLHGVEVNFHGECLRDQATGALSHVHVHCVGLAAADRDVETPGRDRTGALKGRP
ncbi:hypothetical protein [Variovorax saccharolyticus]|uniref:hypothetical protein n=1 Tax=Variovorax saccharolyticus TaxID=3053516 RepID=UPI0025770393|nr:hypothetical protein [Variovorax sp. J31P216]MDM0029785.1 hypothetical protein [Variovorax sp. J31P216]